MANSVAQVVHSVVAHHKDSQCAGVMHRSGAECARDGEKLKRTGRCCLLHLDGASSSDDAVEVDPQAVVQAPVGVIVERARVVWALRISLRVGSGFRSWCVWALRGVHGRV